jgi:hypothetical protein
MYTYIGRTGKFDGFDGSVSTMQIKTQKNII